MNTIDKFMLMAFVVIVSLLTVALQPGPDEVQAAQDVDDDVAAAILLMAEKEACHELRGTDAQVFLLDGQHLVCRAAASTVGADK